MVKLRFEDRNKLISKLEKLPIMGESESRRQILISAGLEDILPQIDLQGPPFIVVSRIVEILESYGRVTFEHESLGRFINRIKELIGANDETQMFLDYLLIHYEMMIPVKISQEPSHWKTTTTSESIFEKIIGENTLREIAFLRKGFEVARAVSYIEVVNQWSGTGFMFTPNLLITNNHVVPAKDLLPTIIFRFNYQLTSDGAMEVTKDYAAKVDGIFQTNAELDYTIIELDLDPGKEWGFLRLQESSIANKDSRVNIIQHPAGLPKQVSLQNNLIAYADSRIIQYYTSTLGGSSGSPVFDDKWQVIGLHHAGGMLYEPGNFLRKYFRNEGITITAILKDLNDTIKQNLFESYN